MSRSVPHLLEDAKDHARRSRNTNFKPLVLGEIQAGGDIVFSGVDQPFIRTGLPLLRGMAAAFTGVAMVAAVSGDRAIETKYERLAALGLFVMFAAPLLSARLAEVFAQPLVALGRRLSLSSSVAGDRPGRYRPSCSVSPRNCCGRPALDPRSLTSS